MSKNQKKYSSFLWNGLLVIVVAILLVPSWRVSFQGFVQRLFMTAVKLEESESTHLTIQPNEWIIYDQNNQPLSFHQYNDKPIVLNFWATWCPPCIAELPGLYKFYGQIKDFAYVFAVSDETAEALNTFNAFEKYQGMIYRTNQSLKALEFSAYPTTFIIAPNFRKVLKIEGAENFATEHNVEFIRNLK